MKYFLSSIVGILIITFTGCSQGTYTTPESVIYANAKFMTEESLSDLIGTIHPESPAFKSTEQMIKELFEMYDLDYKIESLVIVEEGADEATVKFVQKTLKVNGPQFRNNRIEGIHQLKRDGDSWKIYNTSIDNVDYL